MATFSKHPYECSHMSTERKPPGARPKIIVCLDCGAILYMRMNDGTEFVTTEVPHAAGLFKKQAGRERSGAR